METGGTGTNRGERSLAATCLPGGRTTMWLMTRMTSKYESGPEDDELRAIQRSFHGKNVTSLSPILKISEDVNLNTSIKIRDYAEGV